MKGWSDMEQFDGAAALRETKKLPHKNGRRAQALQDAVTQADYAGDYHWRLKLRFETIVELCFYGDSLKAMPTIAEFTSMQEEQPDPLGHEPGWSLCYTLYLGLMLWANTPSLPLEQRERLAKQLLDCLIRYDFGTAAYEQAQFIFYLDSGRFDKAKLHCMNWLTGRDGILALSASASRELELARYLVVSGEWEKGRDLALSLLEKLTSEDDRHDRTSIRTFLLKGALKNGELLLGKQLIEQGIGFSSIGPALALFSRLNQTQGIRVLEQHLPVYLDWWEKNVQMEFFAGAWQLLFSFPPELGIRAAYPKEFPLYREDGVYPSHQLAEWFYSKAEEIAVAFDRRDGTDCRMKRLEELRASAKIVFPGESKKIYLVKESRLTGFLHRIFGRK